MQQENVTGVRHIEIKDGRHTTYAFREDLRQMGFWFTREGNKWTKSVPEEKAEAELRRLRTYCRKKKLRLVEYTDGQVRSNTYREKFFRHNPPFLNGHYVCAYCMRPLERKDVTVDHIIPVRASQTDVRAKRMMRRAGIDDINDIRNLAPACRKCNSEKGMKLGSWVARGRLGRQKWYICFCWGTAIAVGMVFLLFAIAGAIMYLQT